MAEHRRIWPPLVYGGLEAIAAARRSAIEGRRPVQSSERVRTLSERVRTPYRTPYPPPDESSETPSHSPSAALVDPDKRPREQVENDQPISTQVHRATERGRGRRAAAPWQIPWAGWKD